MSYPDDPRKEAIDRLDSDLASFEARRRKAGRPSGGAERGANEGLRVLADLIGGVLGGLGFGWVLDWFAGTGPWGLIGGLLIGLAGGMYLIVRQAARMNAQARARGPAPSVPFDDEDETPGVFGPRREE